MGHAEAAIAGTAILIIFKWSLCNSFEETGLCFVISY